MAPVVADMVGKGTARGGLGAPFARLDGRAAARAAPSDDRGSVRFDPGTIYSPAGEGTRRKRDLRPEKHRPAGTAGGVGPKRDDWDRVGTSIPSLLQIRCDRSTRARTAATGPRPPASRSPGPSPRATASVASIARMTVSSRSRASRAAGRSRPVRPPSRTCPTRSPTRRFPCSRPRALAPEAGRPRQRDPYPPGPGSGAGAGARPARCPIGPRAVRARAGALVRPPLSGPPARSRRAYHRSPCGRPFARP